MPNPRFKFIIKMICCIKFLIFPEPPLNLPLKGKTLKRKAISITYKRDLVQYQCLFNFYLRKITFKNSLSLFGIITNKDNLCNII